MAFLDGEKSSRGKLGSDCAVPKTNLIVLSVAESFLPESSLKSTLEGVAFPGKPTTVRQLCGTLAPCTIAALTLHSSDLFQL